MKKLDFINDKSDKIVNILMTKGFSYNHACYLLRNKDIRIDGIKISKNTVVKAKQEITVYYNETLEKGLKIDIIYQDENILVVDKPSGIEVEGKGGVCEYFNAYAVHRLDRNTTGLMLLAKNEEARQVLEQAFKNRSITKKYLAEVVGKTNFKGEEFIAYLVKDSQNSLVKIYSHKVALSSKIISIFKTIKSSPASSLIECTLVTGKTHQLRAHLAYLGHPIIGDGKYGKNEDNKKFKQKRQLLSCFYISLDKLSGKLSYLNGKVFKKLPSFACTESL